jgi:hypothetical protein
MVLPCRLVAHPLDPFLGLLARHEIEALADVRRFAGSRKLPHFSRDRLATALPRSWSRIPLVRSAWQTAWEGQQIDGKSRSGRRKLPQLCRLHGDLGVPSRGRPPGGTCPTQADGVYLFGGTVLALPPPIRQRLLDCVGPDRSAHHAERRTAPAHLDRGSRNRAGSRPLPAAGPKAEALRLNKQGDRRADPLPGDFFEVPKVE